MEYGTDRTFSAQQWRVVVSVAFGILVAGVVLGVLVGRMTAPTPEPPPASATIMPDVLPSVVVQTPAPAPGDDLDDPVPAPAANAAPSPAPAPAPVVAPAPAPKLAAAAPPPVQLKEVAPKAVAAKPDRPAPKHFDKPKPAPAVVEPEPPAGGPRWVVQLGAFQSSDHANLLVNTLAAHGQPAHVKFTHNAAGQDWFYVQTPPYRSAAAAKSAAQSLAAREHLPTYLLKLPE